MKNFFNKLILTTLFIASTSMAQQSTYSNVLKLIARDVIIEWDKNTESDITGYTIRMVNSSSGQIKDFDAGLGSPVSGNSSKSQFLIQGKDMEVNTLYYFFARARNASGLIGPWSEDSDLSHWMAVDSGVVAIDTSGALQLDKNKLANKFKISPEINSQDGNNVIFNVIYSKTDFDLYHDTLQATLSIETSSDLFNWNYYGDLSSPQSDIGVVQVPLTLFEGKGFIRIKAEFPQTPQEEAVEEAPRVEENNNNNEVIESAQSGEAATSDAPVPEVAGCLDSNAENFNSIATLDDGSCTFHEGCMDSSADNYDDKAVKDNASCTYAYGCTDPAALNFDSNAKHDNASCQYPPLDLGSFLSESSNNSGANADGGTSIESSALE